MMAVLLWPVACLPAMCCWLSVVPAHVERIRARKDMFFPLPSWKEDQGDLVTCLLYTSDAADDWLVV